MPDTASGEECDVLVIGSGSAALSAALRCAVGGLRVTILEKTSLLGGTSAMSGAGTWIPANHHAAAAGLTDSPEEALAYLRATAPDGWREREDHLWEAFVRNAPDMLAFLEQFTPLRFRLTEEPDTMSECDGGKRRGRMLSPQPLRRAGIDLAAPGKQPAAMGHAQDVLFRDQQIATALPHVQQHLPGGFLVPAADALGQDRGQRQRLAAQHGRIDIGQPGAKQPAAHLAQGKLQMGRGGLVRPQMYAQRHGISAGIGRHAA